MSTYMPKCQARIQGGGALGPAPIPGTEGPAPTGLDLSFAGSQGEYICMWRCPRSGLNPSDLVNNSILAAGPQFTEVKIL